MKGIDAEIEGARRKTVLARGLIENLRRDRVIDAAGPDQQGIELLLVLREELQFRRNALGNERRKQRVNERAGRDEGEESDRGAERIFTNSRHSSPLVPKLCLGMPLS